MTNLDKELETLRRKQPQPLPGRSLWSQEMLDDLQDGPHYDGGASARPPGLTKDEYKAIGRGMFIEAAKNPITKDPILVVARRPVVEPELVSETTAVVLSYPERIEVDELPTSAKTVARSATAMGWDVRCWISVSYVEPVLFLNASEEGSKNPHEEGDVRYPGYVLTSYTVEALDQHMGALAFQAFYEGKNEGEERYYEPTGKASFAYARVADPAGVAIELKYDYPPLKVTRGTDNKGKPIETDASFHARERAVVAQSDRLKRTMNGGLHWTTQMYFDAAKVFTAWLNEWKSYA